MSRHPLTRLAMLLAAVPLLATWLAAPAYADSERARDVKGDVTRLDTSTQTFTKRPGNKVLDVVRASGKHAKGKITLTVTPRKLSGGEFFATWHLKRSNGAMRYVYFSQRANGSRSVELTTTSFDKVKCKVRSSVNAKKRIIKAVVPRTCLGKPDWIRYSAGLGQYNGSYIDGDDARIKARGKGDLFGKKLRHN